MAEPVFQVPGKPWTSGYEPSGTSNMKFTMNGALIVGTRDRHLADLTSYAQTQEPLGALHRDPGAWAQKAILNVASWGKVLSDRTIHKYATEIWKGEPCPIP